MVIPPNASKEILVELCCDGNFWGEKLGDLQGHPQDRLPRLLHMPKDEEEEKEAVERTPPPLQQGPAATAHNLSAMQPRTLAFTAPHPAEAPPRDGDGDGDGDGGRKEGGDALLQSSFHAGQGVKRGVTEGGGGGREEEAVGIKDVQELLGNMTERYRKARREREADEVEMEGLRVMAAAEEGRVKECRGLVEAAERELMEGEKQRKVLEEARDRRRKVLSEVEMGAAALTTKLEGMQKVLIRSMEREIEVGDAQTGLEDLVNREQANLNKRARGGDGSNRSASGKQKAYAQRR